MIRRLTPPVLLAVLASCGPKMGADHMIAPSTTSAGAGGSTTQTTAAQTGAGGATASQSGSGGAPQTTTSSSSQSGTGGAIAPDALVEAQGVTITQIAIYQGPKLVLQGGTQTGSVTVPVVAGRDAFVRVFVTTDATYDHSPVTARLILGEGATPIEVTATPTTASIDASLTSTINFDVPGSAIVPGLSYRVELTQPASHSKGGNAGASSPATGFAPIEVTGDGPSLKVVIVPISYGADGSNRMPDTSDAQLKAYQDEFYATYPIQKIEINVHDTFAWTEAVNRDGTGWNDLLDALATFRLQEGVDDDVYYYGVFQPAASLNKFCVNSCVAGLGLVGSANDTFSRAAIGLGFTGGPAAATAIHEIGHTQGRKHAPCGGTQGVDAAFPYTDGDIGDWGYDLVHKRLYAPGQASDMMGYCDPIWISDYTYKSIFDRIKTVNGADVIYPAELIDHEWERARVGMHGELTWLAPARLRTPPSGEAKPITVETSAGVSTMTAEYFAYDHVAGGVLMWPRGAAPATSLRVSIGGRTSRLAR